MFALGSWIFCLFDSGIGIYHIYISYIPFLLFLLHRLHASIKQKTRRIKSTKEAIQKHPKTITPKLERPFHHRLSFIRFYQTDRTQEATSSLNCLNILMHLGTEHVRVHFEASSRETNGLISRES